MNIACEISYRHALEKIGMEANELVRLLLHDLRPHGRPEGAFGTNRHPGDNKMRISLAGPQVQL